MNDKVYFLSKIDLLSALNGQELAELAEDFQWHEYGPGQDIIRQGETEHHFYVLAEGHAESLVGKQGYTSWQVNSFGPGEAFGELALFTGKVAPTTVRSQDQCRVLFLDSEHFARMLVRWPKLYAGFTEKLSHSVNKVNYAVWDARYKEFLRSALQLTRNEDRFYGIWGSVRTSQEIENKINELVQVREHLLLFGEQGTGRQQLAWHIHKRLSGESTPFAVVDGKQFDREWGNMMPEANPADRPTLHGSSLFDLAEGGTLLIKEIHKISARTQLILAEAMQTLEGKCFIVGTVEGDKSQSTSDLVPELRECFEQTYTLAPLRQRKRDIPIIIQGVLEKLGKKHNRPIPTVHAEAMKLLLSHDYRQGNVTELLQVIERAFFLEDTDEIGLEQIFLGPTAQRNGSSIDLLSWGNFMKVIKDGRLILWGQRLTTAIFYISILILFFSPNSGVGVKVLSIIWGLWWPALAIISPILGRVWCTVCPFAYVMELLQHKVHFNRPVPDVLVKYDYLFITFLFPLVFWIETVTHMRVHPGYTIILLLSIQTAAFAFGTIFTRHTWCRHLCPLGGFIGLASIGAFFEIRSDTTMCLNKCTTHECYKGTENVTGCPMSQHLPYLDNNLACKLCFHCVRNCPNDAVEFNLRVPAREIWHLVRINQGYAMLIGVTLAMVIPVIYFEHLRPLWTPIEWQINFSIVYWATVLLAAVLSKLIAQPFRTRAASRRIKLMFAFIPLAISLHVLYQLRFIPGGASLLIGLAWRATNRITQSAFVPSYRVGQVLAATIGLLLTAFSVLMVLVRNRDHGPTSDCHQTHNPPWVPNRRSDAVPSPSPDTVPHPPFDKAL